MSSRYTARHRPSAPRGSAPEQCSMYHCTCTCRMAVHRHVGGLLAYICQKISCLTPARPCIRPHLSPPAVRGEIRARVRGSVALSARHGSRPCTVSQRTTVSQPAHPRTLAAAHTRQGISTRGDASVEGPPLVHVPIPVDPLNHAPHAALCRPLRVYTAPAPRMHAPRFTRTPSWPRHHARTSGSPPETSSCPSRPSRE